MDKSGKKRLAAIGLRSYPPQPGAAGAEKFAIELFPRLQKRGYKITAYTRIYPGQATPASTTHDGITVIPLKTVHTRGFDTLIHSFRSTVHILLHDTADIVHIQNGGNSLWGLVLKLFGKKVFLSMDGIDWKRDKWPWYGKLYLYLSTFLTSRLDDSVIFDNIFTRQWFEKRYKRKYHYIPFGSEVSEEDLNIGIIKKWGLEPGEYFLFVGRFIPDKGLHYLIPAFERTNTSKKLVLVGGSPNPSNYEREIKSTRDERIIFPGYIYGDDVHALMKYAYAYIQASDIEGLSPVLLEVMALETPVICSDIPENLYAVGDEAVTFRKGDSDDLYTKIEFALANPGVLIKNATPAKENTSRRFSWQRVTEEHITLFEKE